MSNLYDTDVFSNYLIARLTVSDDATFSKCMRELLEPVFIRRLHWRLLLAGAANGGKRVHLWQLPEGANLWEGMYTLASSAVYAKLNGVVTQESQELLRLAPFSPDDLRPERNQREYFALEQLALAQCWSWVSDWRERLVRLNAEGKAGPERWSLYGTFRPQTGDLRRQMHVWRLDAADKHREHGNANEAGQDSRGNKVVVGAVPIEVYEAIPYSSN